MITTYKSYVTENGIDIQIYTQNVFSENSVEDLKVTINKTIDDYDYNLSLGLDNHLILINYSLTNEDNTNDMIDKFIVLYKNLDKMYPTIIENYNSVQWVSSDSLSSLLKAKNSSLVIILVTIIVCILSLIATIGIIINSILISIDQNKTSFGILKALGINEKDSFEILLIEIIMNIVIGIIISSIIIFLLSKVLSSLSLKLVDLVNYIGFDGFYGAIVQNKVYPFYVPLITIIIMTIFIVIFSKDSLKKEISAFPIDVILEALL